MADDGSLPGTGTACFGVADPNCNGEEGTPRDGDGVVKQGDIFDASRRAVSITGTDVGFFGDFGPSVANLDGVGFDGV